MKRLPDWLIVYVWRALVGEIYPEIRAIALMLVNKKLVMRYYLTREPCDYDKESIEIVATNLASMVPPDLINDMDVELKYASVPLQDLDYLDGYIYSRREY